MTGFGDARSATAAGAISLEVRSVNNRHLKVTVRGSDPYPMLEGEIEKAVRKQVRRGTVLVQIRAERTSAANARLNLPVLKGYIEQIINDLKGVSAADRASLLSGVLAMPGVAPTDAGAAPEDEWPAVETALEAALKKLNAARKTEGAAMASELKKLADDIAADLEKIRAHVPGIAATYRQRLLDRVRQALGEGGAKV